MASFIRRFGRNSGSGRTGDANGPDANGPDEGPWKPVSIEAGEASRTGFRIPPPGEGTSLPAFGDALRSDRDDGLLANELQQNAPDMQGVYAKPSAIFANAGRTGHLRRLRIRAELRRDALMAIFARLLAEEEALGSQFNLIPVILGTGIALYYLAPSEPSLAALATSALVPAMFALRMQHHTKLWRGLVALAFLFCGMTAAAVHTRMHVQPVPLSEFTARLEGTVIARDTSGSGSPRYEISPSAIEGLPPDLLPDRIRLTARTAHEVFRPGESVRGLARLQPFSGPAYPGGYDFSFFAWHDGLAMTGFFMGRPEREKTDSSTPGTFKTISAAIGEWRTAISQRIRTALPGETGDIATALVTGDRSGLSDDTEESLRASGLAHILAISGLHMALVTLTVIWIVRFALVHIPGLAVNWPIQKWAVAAGFAVSSGYLLLSGAGIATQRAWLMITVMLAANLMDRRALTMRNVAVAAIAILLIDPVSLFQPGFQMSFAAVAALVAFYGWINKRRMRSRQTGFEVERGYATKLVRYLAGIAATSLVAGMATGLFSAWHFHRVALFGLAANLAAMPIVSIAVMPLALLSVLLMPYGFEGLALAPLHHAIQAVLAVSAKVNEWGGDQSTGVVPAGIVLSGVTTLGLLCLLGSRLRLLAIVPFAGFLTLSALAGAGIYQPARPDILLSQGGRAIAIRDADGSYFLAPGSRERFTTDIWKRAWSPRGYAEAPASTLPCTRDRCDLTVQRQRLSFVYAPDEIGEACREADILLAPRLWWVNCDDRRPGLIVTRTELEKYGSHAFYNDGKDASAPVWRAVTAWPGAVENPRPWLKRYEVPKEVKFARKTKTAQEQARTSGR
jgi:competence protein ComEC